MTSGFKHENRFRESWSHGEWWYNTLGFDEFWGGNRCKSDEGGMTGFGTAKISPKCHMSVMGHTIQNRTTTTPAPPWARQYFWKEGTPPNLFQISEKTVNWPSGFKAISTMTMPFLGTSGHVAKDCPKASSAAAKSCAANSDNSGSSTSSLDPKRLSLSKTHMTKYCIDLPLCKQSSMHPHLLTPGSLTTLWFCTLWLLTPAGHWTLQLSMPPLTFLLILSSSPSWNLDHPTHFWTPYPSSTSIKIDLTPSTPHPVHHPGTSAYPTPYCRP